jgi:putative aminopeptidase FrvX
MPLELDELKALSELPSVATACGPAREFLRSLLPHYAFTEVPDGGLVALPRGTAAEQVRLLFVTHVDEIGGFVSFPEEGGFGARLIGNRAEAFADRPLQAFRYDAVDASGTIPCRGRVGDDGRLILEGAGLEPLTMLWTFQEPFRVEGDVISGKALDPRVTVYCAVEAARRLGRADLGLIFCYAEECSRNPAAKLVEHARRQMSSLELVVNADVPGLGNIVGIGLEEVAIRPFEGGDLIDPCFSLRLYERLRERGVEVKLGVAESRSQTSMFVPVASAVSVALPSHGVHQARVEMSRTGVERCVALLQAIGEIA